MKTSTRRVGRGLVGAVLMAALAHPAAAAAPEQHSFEGSFPGTACGLDLDLYVRAHWSIQFQHHGPDGLPHFKANYHGVNHWTNPETGVTLIGSFNQVDKDLVLTDNGDGTSTGVAIWTGSSLLKEEHGRVVWSDPGQSRTTFLFDNGGTPTDPSDDELIGEHVPIRESTGRNDTEEQWCEVMHQYLG